MEIINIQQRLATRATMPNEFFDNLYRYIKDEKFLRAALVNVSKNTSANTPGVDGITRAKIKNVDQFITELKTELDATQYCPRPTKKAFIAKENGKNRSLGIPCFRDRVVQEACRMIIEPIYESKFIRSSLGYRPKRNAKDACQLITFYGSDRLKYFWVVEGAVEGCFDYLPHKALIDRLKATIVCKKTIKLIKNWLNAGVYLEGRISKPNVGIYQTGVIAPLLLNIFLDIIDQYWLKTYGSLTPGQKDYRRIKGLGNVNYLRFADDFLIMTNGKKEAAYALRDEFNKALNDFSLNLNEKKAKVTHVNDGFDFLSWRFQRKYSPHSKKYILLAKPSEVSIAEFKRKVEFILSRKTVNQSVALTIKALNAVLRKWYNYHKHTNAAGIFDRLKRYVHFRIYYWLKWKHSNVSSQGSVKKYIVNKYASKKGFCSEGVCECKPPKIKRHKIKWPKTNPYLENFRPNNLIESYDALRKLWKGNSIKGSYHGAWSRLVSIYGYKCMWCDNTKKLHLHHIKPRSKGGDNSFSNCIILCRNCHKIAHGR